MATGALNAQGIWQYDEGDLVSPLSAYMNKLSNSTTAQLLADRARLTSLEALLAANGAGQFTPEGIYAKGTPKPQAVREGNRVYLEGLITSSTADFVKGLEYTLGSIPVAFAPADVRAFSVAINGTATAQLAVGPDGSITFTGNTTFTGSLLLSLGSVSWRVN